MISETPSQSSGSVFLAVMLWVKMYFMRESTLRHRGICDKSVQNSIPITYVRFICQGNVWVEFFTAFGAILEKVFKSQGTYFDSAYMYLTGRPSLYQGFHLSSIQYQLDGQCL